MGGDGGRGRLWRRSLPPLGSCYGVGCAPAGIWACGAHGRSPRPACTCPALLPPAWYQCGHRARTQSTKGAAGDRAGARQQAPGGTGAHPSHIVRAGGHTRVTCRWSPARHWVQDRGQNHQRVERVWVHPGAAPGGGGHLEGTSPGRFLAVTGELRAQPDDAGPGLGPAGSFQSLPAPQTPETHQLGWTPALPLSSCEGLR